MSERLVEELARRLVDHPDDVRVERGERDGVAVLRLHVAPDDVGKVIGRQGRMARANANNSRRYFGNASASGTESGRIAVRAL